jgi:hypothetical protein
LVRPLSLLAGSSNTTRIHAARPAIRQPEIDANDLQTHSGPLFQQVLVCFAVQQTSTVNASAKPICRGIAQFPAVFRPQLGGA